MDNYGFENHVFKYYQLDREIINSVVNEKSTKEIADSTGYSVGMIKFRLGTIYRKYRVKTKAGLVREAIKRNLLA